MSKKSRASFGPEGTETPTSTPNATPEPSLTPAVEESLQRLLLRGKTNPFYPRCEYYTRYGSAFQMKSPRYWGTYHRSTQRGSRFTKNYKDKIFENEALTQQTGKNHTHIGAIKNPYSFEKYRSMVEKPLKKLPPSNTPVPVPDLAHLDPRNNSTSNNIPYETLLDYRNRICLEARKHYLSIIKAQQHYLSIIKAQQHYLSIIKVQQHYLSIIKAQKHYLSIIKARKHYRFITKAQKPYLSIIKTRKHYRFITKAQKPYLSFTEAKDPLQIIHHNNYPYLLIKIPFIQGIKNVEPFNQLWMAYYVAIVNHNAKKANIPIEMVIRSSFGHLMPSIDSTGETFRINVGIVPKIYGCIIAESLSYLHKVLNELEFGKIEEGWLKEKNDAIRVYNDSHSGSINPWTNNLYNILQLNGDTKGQSVAYQIVRKQEMRDLLADYVAEELDRDSPDFVSPLVKMLDRLAFGKQVSMEFSDNDFKRNSRKWQASENEAIRNDESFWKLIKQCVDRVGGSPTLYMNRQVLGLYARLDNCNQEFIIRSASTQTAEDGGGSDSDYEDTATPLFYKKMIFHTGMMAISVAYYLARFYVKEFLKKDDFQIECKNMYYETEDALKLSVKGCDVLATLKKRPTVKTAKTLLPFCSLILTIATNWAQVAIL
jgi:hypothetical protein